MRIGQLLTNGAEIRRLRQLKGLNVRRLAAITGISESHLSNVELSRRTFGPARLKLIADALGVEPEALVVGGTQPEQLAA